MVDIINSINGHTIEDKTQTLAQQIFSSATEKVYNAAEKLKQAASETETGVALIPKTGTSNNYVNSTEAIFDYLKKNYDSFNHNQDYSYVSMNLADAKKFIKNLEKDYLTIAKSCPNDSSLEKALIEILTKNKISVFPTKGIANYYSVKNNLGNGLLAIQGVSQTIFVKTIPVALRPGFLLNGMPMLGTSFILSFALSLVEDLMPWKSTKIICSTMRSVTLLPIKGAEIVVNTVFSIPERLFLGMSLPANITKALATGPGLTLKDLDSKETKQIINRILKLLTAND